MHHLVVQAWADEVNKALLHVGNSTVDPALQAPPKRPCNDMSSPCKRQRTNPDPDQTPTRPSRHESLPDAFADTATGASTRSESSFAAALASRPALSHQQSPVNISHSTLTSRSSSPSKRLQKTAGLLDLLRPVHFVKEQHVGRALPDDAQQLFQSLSAIEAKEAVLPTSLRGHSDFDDARIRGYMWEPARAPDASSANDQTEAELLLNHSRLQAIVDDSVSSSNLHRSEAAWNCLVHTPLLRHALSRFPHLQVEPIASARIAPPFRPLTKTGYPTPSLPSSTSASVTSSTSAHELQTSNAASARLTSSVHKMVDFALVLCPNKETQALVDAFLDRQPPATATINQTKYEPLRARPAPIFIETKTASGNLEAANAQLGVWVAAWHERLRSIIALGHKDDKVLTIPVIQVIGSVWTLLFVVDSGVDIRVVDGNFRIGDTDSIFGIYQLQAAMSALAKWAKHTFEPWFASVLASAIASPLDVAPT